MELKSEAFNAGERIPERYTCDNEDLSPPLSWGGAPEGTKSLALICDDPDAPGGTWTHWAVYDIPASVTHLDEGYAKDAQVGETHQATTDFGRSGYGGPCPPRGHGTHHYHFRVLALDVEKLDVAAGAKVNEVEQAARPHTLASAGLVGIYSR